MHHSAPSLSKTHAVTETKRLNCLMVFYASSPSKTCAGSYRKRSNSYAKTPTLTPNPSPAPPGGKGEPTPLCGNGFEVTEFNVDGQRSKRRSTAKPCPSFFALRFSVPIS